MRRHAPEVSGVIKGFCTASKQCPSRARKLAGCHRPWLAFSSPGGPWLYIYPACSLLSLGSNAPCCILEAGSNVKLKLLSSKSQSHRHNVEDWADKAAAAKLETCPTAALRNIAGEVTTRVTPSSPLLI